MGAPSGRGGRIRTCSRRVLSEITLLVSGNKTFGNRLRSWSSRKFLVEADYALHANGIFGRTKSLIFSPSAHVLQSLSPHSFVCGSAGSGSFGGEGVEAQLKGREKLTVGEAT